MFPIHSCCLTTTLLHKTQTPTQSSSPAFFLHLFFYTPLFFCGSLELSVCCQQADLILAIASQTALSILGLTETWIRPEDLATPAALSNNFSHTPVRLGRVEVLVFSFLTIGNTQPTLPYAIITHLNLMLLL